MRILLHSGAHLLGYICTALNFLQPWQQFRYKLARFSRRQMADFLWLVIHHCFHLFMAVLCSLFIPTTSWSTEHYGHLVALCFRSVFSSGNLLHRANIPWPTNTLLFSGVALHHLLALLLLYCFALCHILFHLHNNTSVRFECC